MNLRRSGIAISCMLVLLACKKSETIKQKEQPVNHIAAKQTGALSAEEVVYRGQLASAVTDGRVIEIAGLSTDDGAFVQQWQWLSLNSQKWTAQRISGNNFRIINIGSRKVLTSPNNTPGARLHQAVYNGTDAQIWRVVSGGIGQLYRLVNKNGLAVSLTNPGGGDGAEVTQEVADGSASQLWFIQRLFANPVRAAVADPWVVQRNGTYYFLATTGWNITIRKTKRMSELKDAPGKLAWLPPAGQAYSSNIWAPEMHHLDGKWYVYFAGDDGNDANHRMYVLENPADDPTTGTWTYKGKIGDDSNIWAIDGSVFEHNGKRYFMWSGWRFQNTSQSGIQQIYIAEMSNPWTISSARYMISEPTYNWEKAGLVNEGPQILKNAAGDVFIVYSASGCWTDDYKLGMMKLTGSDPLQQDSWTKYTDPVFQKSIANSVYAPGHNSFFKSPDGREDWIIYHANAASGLGCGGSRSTRIQPFTWNEDGTPNFGVPKPITEALAAPSGEGF